MTIKRGVMVILLAGGIVVEAQATEATQTPAPIDTGKSCEELYLEVEALLAIKDEASAGFWNDQNNQAAGAARSGFQTGLVLSGVRCDKTFSGQAGLR